MKYIENFYNKCQPHAIPQHTLDSDEREAPMQEEDDECIIEDVTSRLRHINMQQLNNRSSMSLHRDHYPHHYQSHSEQFQEEEATHRDNEAD